MNPSYSNKKDWLGGLPLPTCPFQTSAIPSSAPSPSFIMQNPAATITFLTSTLASLSFGLLVLSKYNSVKIFNKRIRDPSIVNWAWGLFFFVISSSNLIDFVRYSLSLPFTQTPSASKSGRVEPQIVDAWLLAFSASARCIATLILQLALLQHRKFKSASYGLVADDSNMFGRGTRMGYSSVPSNPAGSSSEDVNLPGKGIEEGLEDEGRNVGETDQRWDFAWFLLGLAASRVLSLYFVLNSPESLDQIFRFPPVFNRTYTRDTASVWVWTDIVTNILQNFPTLNLVFGIVTEDRAISPSTRRQVGMSEKYRWMLILATILGISRWIEPSIWSRFFVSGVIGSEYSIESNLCIVPPYLWYNSSEIGPQQYVSATVNPRSLRPLLASLDGPAMEFKDVPEAIVPLHGWASVVDLIMWCGGVQVILLFLVCRGEYKRIRDEWVRVAVTRLQSTFNYQRL